MPKSPKPKRIIVALDDIKNEHMALRVLVHLLYSLYLRFAIRDLPNTHCFTWVTRMQLLRDMCSVSHRAI